MGLRMINLSTASNKHGEVELRDRAPISDVHVHPLAAKDYWIPGPDEWTDNGPYNPEAHGKDKKFYV